MQKFGLHILIFLLAVTTNISAQNNWSEYSPAHRVYQWRVDLDSVPTGNPLAPRRAYLWLPSSCQQVRGLVFSGHNAMEEGILEDRLFRKTLEKLGFGEVWVTPDIDEAGMFDVSRGAQKSFDEAMEKLADISGYNEIRYAPIVYMSHSAQASEPWNFGAFNPERALALISFHGDSPLSTYLCCNHFNPDWGDRNIDGIPSLMAIGSEEWNEFRIIDAFKFMRQYPESLISLLVNSGCGHGDYSQEDLKYLLAFIEKAVQKRMPARWEGDNMMPLKKINRKEGWLADRWHPNSLPTATTNAFSAYGGNRDSAFWYFDEQMARWTESIQYRDRNKKKQYLTMMQNGRILKPDELLTFTTDGRNIEVNARAVFVDSSYSRLSDEHTIEPLFLKRYSGCAEIVNDTTFRLQFYRVGVQHPKIANINLFAFAESDLFYRHAVRGFSWKMPAALKDGKPQKINFPSIKDVREGVPSIMLNATADSKLPVRYYVESGAAYVDGNRLILTKLPPRAKLPHKITVVAWQYGNTDYRTARAVERVFYINGHARQ
jgi:hypothetical protein